MSWGVIFDPEMSEPFAGKIQMLNDERETLGAALKYLGYSLNSTNEDEINEAAELIRAAKDRIATFDSDAYDDLLMSGETLSPTASTATSSSRSTRRTPGRPSATRSRSRAGPSGWTTWRSR